MAEVRIISFAGRNVVWPPYVVVKQGETVTFIAVNTEATVFLPKPELFELAETAGPGVGEAKIMGRAVLKVKDKPVSVKVRSKPHRSHPNAGIGQAGAGRLESFPIPGIYPYAVYCENGNDFAEGNTSPIMIIEPPD